jgi:hypothetical protein
MGASFYCLATIGQSVVAQLSCGKTQCSFDIYFQGAILPQAVAKLLLRLIAPKPLAQSREILTVIGQWCALVVADF